MFKKLVSKMTTIRTRDDQNEIFGEIDKAFDQGKITWNDHETLYTLVSMIKTND